MTYYMTSTDAGTWEPCKSASLTGAKREATAAYGAGYVHSLIKIAVGDGIAVERQEVATRLNSGSRWTNQ